jgi:hypothetical protein
LALGDELLLHDRLLLILRAFLHEPLDRFVILVLAGALIDHQVLFGQALLTLGLRCFELSTSARVLNLKTCHLAQCDINTGAVIDRKMLRVTPPSKNSRKREWP